MQMFLSVLSVLLIVSVFITLVRNDFWLYKVLEYPRLQKLFLVCTALAAWALYLPPRALLRQPFFVGLVVAALYLIYKIYPYTILAAKEMKRIAATDPAAELRVYSANVLQYNRQYQRMLEQIRANNPDIIFLLETDKGWAGAMQELQADYPHTLLEPLDNTYGLLFYSRLKLEKARVVYLVKDYIPSIEAQLHLPSGEKIQLWGIHPEPPVPGESLTSTAKDKELMKIALKARDCPLPCIVFGDLNDVAWSHTTLLFRKTSGLLDPRRGRGFYSTFSAHHWFIRFPLDYIFCSREFGLVQMKRLPRNGSDHFAIITHLAFHKQLEKEQQPAQANGEEIEEAREMASQPVDQS